MDTSHEYMSGRNQEKGNKVALIISVILIAGFIIGFLIFA